MLTKKFTFLFTAIAAFLLGFKLQPENLAFKATVAPVVTLDEDIRLPTKTLVSLNLSFEIHPQATIIDLFETVTTECQQLYKVYAPVAIDLFNTASDELARAYETYQPIAWELFDEIIRPFALDLLDNISAALQQLYHGTFTEPPFDDQATCIAFLQVDAFKSFKSCYENYDSAVQDLTDTCGSIHHELVLGCIRTHFSLVAPSVLVNLDQDAPPRTLSSEMADHHRRLSQEEEEDSPPTTSSHEKDNLPNDHDGDDGSNNSTITRSKPLEYEFYKMGEPTLKFVKKLPLSYRLHSHAEVFVKSASEDLVKLCSCLWTLGYAIADSIVYNIKYEIMKQQAKQ
ncbi:unnamed protein product [Cylindrotheca closterium]|uniref:Uncharacterized protein n=1 Tax=Cylindrotheca closterium TaxID=2856 RepID=A0AAD2FIN4_9STRA|nr:unnamed protein product [Cylindrotheca closterium]